MPTVLEPLDLREESTVNFSVAAPPHVWKAPVGLWQRLRQGVGRLYAGRPHRLTYDGGVARMPLEAYQERLAREQPYLYICAYTISGG